MNGGDIGKFNIVENLGIICVEDIFDFDTQTLILIQQEIEMRLLNKGKLMNEKENQKDDDSFSVSITEFSNTNTINNKKLNKLYPFVLSEIKERAYHDEILNFFMNDDFKKSSSNYLEEISNYCNQDKIETIGKFALIDYPNKIFKDNLNANYHPQIKSENRSNNIPETNINYIKNAHFHPENKNSEFSLVNTHISIMPPDIKNKPSIKSILAKTKVDDNFKFLVGQSTLRRNIKTAPNKTLPSIENKKLPLDSNFKERAAITNEAFFKNKTIMVRKYSEVPKISLKKLKKPKLLKVKKRNKSVVEKTNLEKRKEYLVPDIKKFINNMRNNPINQTIINNKETIKSSPEKLQKKIKIIIVNKEKPEDTINDITKSSIDIKSENSKNDKQVENKNNINLVPNSRGFDTVNISTLDVMKISTDHQDHPIIKSKDYNNIIQNKTEEFSIKKEQFHRKKSTDNYNLQYEKFKSNKNNLDNLRQSANSNSFENSDYKNTNFLQPSRIFTNQIFMVVNNEEFSIQRKIDLDKNEIELKNCDHINEDKCISPYHNEQLKNDNNNNFENKSLKIIPQNNQSKQEYENDEDLKNNSENGNKYDLNNLIIENVNQSPNTRIDADIIRTNVEKFYKNSIVRKSKSDMRESNPITSKSSKFISYCTSTQTTSASNEYSMNKFYTSQPKTYSTSNNFYKTMNNKNLLNNHRKKSIMGLIQERSKSSKMPLVKHFSNNISSLTDYSKIYKNYNELFSGYFLRKEINYSCKQFDLCSIMATLYESFKNLYNYESYDVYLNNKNNFHQSNKNVLEAEEAIRKNRLIQVSNKLLTDPNLDQKGYYILKQILEIQKKENEKMNCNLNNENLEENIIVKNRMYFRVVLSRPEIYDIVCYTLGLREQWSEMPHGLSLGNCWNLMWTYSTPNIDLMKLFSFQKVNHLINNRVLSRKDLLKKSIDRVRKLSPKLNKYFDIMPSTYILCKEYVDFLDEFMKVKNNLSNPLHNYWIVKPVGKSRGRGIFLTNDIAEVPLADGHLVQKYLTDPLLIDGYKFDMRIYVLVTSVNPLEAFIYKDGFARMSTYPYCLDNCDRLIHLTNAAIQNSAAKKFNNDDYEKLYGGSKISLDMLKNKLTHMGVNFEQVIWRQIKDIVLKSLAVCQNDIPYCPSTFELFGYDIIIDKNLRCWLLEVNSSPSLERTSVLDDKVKLKLVEDCLNVVDPINYDRGELIEMLERRMNITQSNSNNTYLYSPFIQLNIDLNRIFKGKLPRSYGEVPEKLGNFEILSPTKESECIIKMIEGQKLYANKSQK